MKDEATFKIVGKLEWVCKQKIRIGDKLFSFIEITLTIKNKKNNVKDVFGNNVKNIFLLKLTRRNENYCDLVKKLEKLQNEMVIIKGDLYYGLSWPRLDIKSIRKKSK